MFPKPKTERDEDYKAWIRTLPCLCCLKSPCAPHHVPKKGHGGERIKTSDRRCIPLCGGLRGHHREAHDAGKDTFALWWGIRYEEIIQRLNTIYEEQKEVK